MIWPQLVPAEGYPTNFFIYDFLHGLCADYTGTWLLLIILTNVARRELHIILKTNMQKWI
jgi:hypothetical protein